MKFKGLMKRKRKAQEGISQFSALGMFQFHARGKLTLGLF
jgi:hypothetical protein